jgi:AcrR family transcriptional regulator
VAARDNQRARTRRDLVGAAVGLLRQGQTPTVAEVAEAAGVSRRTAYRYFASADHLMVDALLEDMRSDVEGEIDAGAVEDEDIATRVDRLVDALHHLTVDKEQLLRQMIRFTLDRGPIEPGVPPRPSRRLEYVDQALSPLQATLAPEGYERLVHAMAVVIGIEARIVLRDICGLDDDAILETERWAAQALLDAAQREAADDARRERRSPAAARRRRAARQESSAGSPRGVPRPSS